jgi:hypothetical protein
MIQHRTRRRLRAGGLLAIVLGLLSLGYGFAAPSLAPDLPPRPVPVDRPVALPRTGPFGGTLALYGNPALSGARPSLAQLGCTLRTRTGTIAGRGLSASGAAGLDRLVVDGRALVPLLAITGTSSGSTISCPAGASQPLYLIVTTGRRDLVPMAAFSFATLALVLGSAGLIAMRPVD